VYKFKTSPGPDRDAKGVEGAGNGEGCPPPQPTRGPGGAS